MAWLDFFTGMITGLFLYHCWVMEGFKVF